METKVDALNRIRWVVLMEKKEVDTFQHDMFKVIYKVNQCFNEDYTLLQLEGTVPDFDFTAEDVLIETGALAVHEEFTNGVIVTSDTLETISDEIYTWNGAGGCLLGDMLTDLEKLDSIMKYFYTETKQAVGVDDITIRLSKDGAKFPIKNHLEELFDGSAYSAHYKEHDCTIWWASIIEDLGFFLVVLDEEEDDDEYEDPYENSRYPLSRYYGEYDWGGYGYDDYDYDDRYYKRT